ncbi:hypothetical protein HZA40_04005 [Candidatus Peregrinibacteria bacterium]|nr:hypothetical protein [Candidatus Peregrinibacteria bacterium]
MCFSATASFASGTALSIMGTAAIIRNKDKKNIALATIPLFFGIQQIFEGFVWNTASATLYHQISVYGFLAFALVFWPFYAPLAFYLTEKNRLRKKIMGVLFLLGITVSFYFLILLITQTIYSEVANNSIAYIIDAPLVIFFTIVYFIATCTSALTSSHKRLRNFGILLTISLALSLYFYFVTFTSVWCFFAAILSIIIFLYINDEYKQHAKQKI